MKNLIETCYSMSQCQPCVRMIFKHITENQSDLNSKVISCLVPMILKKDDPSNLVIPLFADESEVENENKYMNELNLEGH